jgi:hypothetical protein
MKWPSTAYVLKTLSPACGTIGRWWNLLGIVVLRVVGTPALPVSPWFWAMKEISYSATYFLPWCIASPRTKSTGSTWWSGMSEITRQYTPFFLLSCLCQAFSAVTESWLIQFFFCFHRILGIHFIFMEKDIGTLKGIELNM